MSEQMTDEKSKDILNVIDHQYAMLFMSFIAIAFILGLYAGIRYQKSHTSHDQIGVRNEQYR